MAEEDLQSDLKCQSEQHHQHLCYLISQGFHLSDEQEYKALTDSPEFRCGHCHRKANSGQNVCVPVDLAHVTDLDSSAANMATDSKLSQPGN